MQSFDNQNRAKRKLKRTVMTKKLIKTTDIKDKVKYYSVNKFINKLNKGLINVEGNVIEVVKVKLVFGGAK